MYLHEPKPFDIIKKQVHFKLNTNASYFTILIALQFLALIFQPTNHSTAPFVSIVGISSTVHIGLLVLWAFFLGVTLATRARVDEAFAFVTTRSIHHLSNLIYIMIASFIGALIASFIGPALRLFTQLKYGSPISITPTLTEAPEQFLIYFITAFAYLLLFFIGGYTISAFIQLWKTRGDFVFLGIIVTVVIISFIFGIEIIIPITVFFLNESFLSLFLFKVFVVCSALFSFAVLITNRMEVRN